jgi:hypothetical protein
VPSRGRRGGAPDGGGDGGMRSGGATTVASARQGISSDGARPHARAGRAAALGLVPVGEEQRWWPPPDGGLGG